jgi:anti-sigma regulatory factor (Ser/Thr protein kinase)
MVERELPHDHSAPGLARQRLTDSLADGLGRDDLERARLITTELVTNPVVHGRGTITVRKNPAD